MEALPVIPIASEQLNPDTFPQKRDPFNILVAFAYSFDGYAHFGMEACAALANETLSTFYHTNILPNDMDILRTCLFFEARRWSLYQREPDNKGLIYMHALIDRIKKKVLESCDVPGV
jgi:hypothetical protein